MSGFFSTSSSSATRTPLRRSQPANPPYRPAEDFNPTDTITNLFRNTYLTRSPTNQPRFPRPKEDRSLNLTHYQSARLIANRPAPKQFAQAIISLHKKLLEAKKFYTSTKTNFEKATKGIKSYADPQVMGQLWTLKVCKKNEKGDSVQQKFAYWSREIQSALDQVAFSAEQERLVGDSNGLMQKLRIGAGELFDDLDSAVLCFEFCECLIFRIEGLVLVVDPEMGFNRILLRDGVVKGMSVVVVEKSASEDGDDGEREGDGDDGDAAETSGNGDGDATQGW